MLLDSDSCSARAQVNKQSSHIWVKPARHMTHLFASSAQHWIIKHWVVLQFMQI